MTNSPFCCEDLRSAYELTFFNPMPGQSDWLAYGTDFETVSAGAPEIRFWPVRFCPFCGTSLPPANHFPPRTQPPSGQRSGVRGS
jgi:hypothetical protein